LNWFEAITGFSEASYSQTQKRLKVIKGQLTSEVSPRSFAVGSLEIPSLGELRKRTEHLKPTARSTIAIVRGDVRELHADSANAGALFQVASQFNLLEMIGPEVSPEDGVTRYEFDRTQGPACAVAAGAATIFRNYLVPFPDGKIGQTKERQIDCLHDIREALGNEDEALWQMKNGYALFKREGLASVDQHLAAASEDAIDQLRCLLRIGLHWGVGLTDVEPGPTVSQAFCSALPVSYNRIEADGLWTRFATLILEGAYEATLRAAWLNAARSGCHRVFLTRLGGGAFGNDTVWIDDAIRRALEQAAGWGLDIRLVSYGHPDQALQELAGPGPMPVR
jgi:hypothetical protein